MKSRNQQIISEPTDNAEQVSTTAQHEKTLWPKEIFDNPRKAEWQMKGQGVKANVNFVVLPLIMILFMSG